MSLGCTPGDATITAELPGRPHCRGVGADAPYPVRLRILAGVMTSAGVIVCEDEAPPPP